MITQSPPSRTAAPAVEPAHLFGVAVAGTVGATLAAATVWTIAVPIAGVALRTTSGVGIGIVSVVLVSLIVGAAGFGLLGLLARRGHVTAWTVLASAVLLLSLAGPSGAANAAAMVSLLCLHLAVGGITIGAGRFGVRRT